MSGLNLYESIIKPIRDADRTLLVKDYLEGKQLQYNNIRSRAEKLFALNDLFTQDNRQVLLALLWQLGFEGDLQKIFEGWTNLQLRKMLSIVADLWKNRGMVSGIEAIIKIFLPGANYILRDWFWYRPIEGETYPEGHNSPDAFWPIDGVGLGVSEFSTDIYLVADAEQANLIIAPPMNLIRGNSERLNLLYVNFIDTFAEPYLGNWIITVAVNGYPAVDMDYDGSWAVFLGNAEMECAGLNLDDLFILLSLMQGGTTGLRVKFRYVDSSNYLYVQASPSNTKLVEVVGGTPTTIKEIFTDIVPGIRYDLLIEAQGNRVLVFLGGDLIIDEPVSITSSGAIRMGGAGGWFLGIEDVVVSEIPFDTFYIGP